VSAYLGEMTVLWLAVPDEPGPTSDRAVIERNSIALLSNGLRPTDPPSESWLGLHSSRHEIRDSGLWNLNHVQAEFETVGLEMFKRRLSAMEAISRPKG
jgi:hypothetical protein